MKRSSVYFLVTGLFFIGIWDRKKKKESFFKLKKEKEKFSDHYQLLNHWLEIKNEGKNVALYLEEVGIHHIAIYGMAELANRLVEDIGESNVVIDYGIDQDISCSIARISEVYSPEDVLPTTELIIVTPYHVFDEIKKKLEHKVSCPIVSLEEVIWSL